MVDIVTRLGKGSPLTNAEVDANFTNLAEVSGVTGEPMGHEDRTTSTISFNASTRTFTIAPTVSSFTVWCKGKKVVVSSAQTVVIPNTTGMYSIYFDSTGALAAKAGYFTFAEEAPTAYVYWNATTGTAPYFGDERHGVVLDWQTHEYLHRTRGAALASGFSASGYVLGGNGSSNSHAQLTLEGGTFFDEDMKIIVTATNTPTAGTWEQDLTSPARIPVLYLSGTAWVIDSPTDYPLKQGTARPQYNALSGGVWSTADVANNKYATSWILATNNLTYPVIAIIGQAESDLQSAAEAVDFTELQLPGFPSVEFRPLYKLIFQCADSCTNAVHASLVSITDIRSIAAAGTAASIVTDHGNLSGLSDDDHPQYLSVDTVRGSLTAAVKASFLPSQTSNAGKFLQTDGTATSWQALTSGNVTTALGFTPYNATNPSGYITGISSSDVTTALGFTPYNATNPSGYVNAAGARGSISVTGAGSYDSASGVINIVGGVTSFNTRTGAITLSSADVTTALGFTPYNNSNPSGYITGITSTMVTTALGYTPYNSSNPNGYISGITSGMVTTALGFTPYNNSNPSGYITSSALSGYLTSASAASTYLALSGGTLTGSLTISAGANTQLTVRGAEADIWLNSTGPDATWRILGSTGGNTHRFRIYDHTNSADRLNINSSGSVTALVDYRAPVFYDSGNTSYYVDPNGTSVLSALTVNQGTSGAALTTFTNSSTATTAYTEAQVINGSRKLVLGASLSYADVEWQGTWVYSSSGSLKLKGFDTASTVEIYANGYTDAYKVARFTNTGLFLDRTTTIATDVRAPIFYDSNDTAYYVDPHSASKVLGLTVGNNTNTAGFLNVSRGPYNQVNITHGSNSGWGLLLGHGDGSLTGGYHGSSVAAIINVPNAKLVFGTDNTARAEITAAGSIYGYSDVRTPIFYDSADTAYYVDPNSNSRLSSISIPVGSVGFVNVVRGSSFGYSSGYGAIIYGSTSGSVTPCFNVDPIANPSGSFTGNGGDVMFRNGVQFISPNSANNGYNSYFTLQDGYVQATGSLRAPVFYDSANTGFYINPNDLSTIYQLHVDGAHIGGYGIIKVTSDNDALISLNTENNATAGMRLQSGSGGTDLLFVGKKGSSDTSFVVDFGFAQTNEEFIVDASGNTESRTSSRAPIFYDSNNTAYYANPAATSNFHTLEVGTGPGGNNAGNLYIKGNNTFRWIAGYAPDYGVGNGFGLYSDTLGGYYTSLSTSGNWWFGLNDHSSSYRVSINGTGYATNDFRAPIFYDSADTAYYGDFNNGGVKAWRNAGYSGGISVADTGGYLSYRITTNNHSDGWQWQFTTNDITSGSGTKSFWVTYDGGHAYAAGSMRAPIFYDSDDTSRYVNPNGTTNIGSWTSNSITNIQTGSGSAVWQQITNTDGGGTYAYLQLTTVGSGNGYLIKNRTTGNSVGNQSLYLWNDPGPIEFVPNGDTAIRTTISTTGAMTIRGPASTQLTVRGTEADIWLYSTGPDTTWRILGATGTTTHRFRIYDHTNSAERFYINSNGNVSAQIDFRAPIFYDSNNTNFYLNPEEISSLYGLAIRGDQASTGVGNQIFFWGSGTTTTSAIGFKANGGNFPNPTGNGDGYNTYLTMDTTGRGWVFREGVGGSDFNALYTSGWILNNGVWQANASMRSPIFYDSNNTGYYTDPASTSALNYVNINGYVGIGVAPGSTVSGARMELRGSGVWDSAFNWTNTGTGGRTWSVFSTNDAFGQGGGRFLLYNNTGGTNGFAVDPSNNLTVGGNVTAYGTVSDRRLKHNIREIPTAIKQVLALKPVYYSWNEDTDQHRIAGMTDDLGFIAQDAEEVEPLLVRAGSDGMLGLRERGIIALLTKSFQEQNQEVVDLRNRVAQLESLINKLIGD